MGARGKGGWAESGLWARDEGCGGEWWPGRRGRCGASGAGRVASGSEGLEGCVVCGSRAPRGQYRWGGTEQTGPMGGGVCVNISLVRRVTVVTW